MKRCVTVVLHLDTMGSRPTSNTNKRTTQEQDHQPLLSHWWRTASAQACFDRVKQQKKEALIRLRETTKAKQEQLKRDVDEWVDKNPDEIPKKERSKTKTTAKKRRTRKITRKR